MVNNFYIVNVTLIRANKQSAKIAFFNACLRLNISTIANAFVPKNRKEKREKTENLRPSLLGMF